ncbi:unnamed protein product [Adineta steineri]|uniref:Uncharacterized protein n=1 Tax=Adineta steineri TaxID=433720 RepID=A0A818LRG6_9BILA|nr:unnamed protein product [Adineta steineri]
MASNYIQSSVVNERTHSSSEIPARSFSTNSSNSKEHLYTNHFACSVDNNITLCQYDAAIEEMDTRSNVWKECEGRSRCAIIMQSIISDHQLEPNVFVWYDEQKCLYSTSYLSTPYLKLDQNNRHRLNIKSLSNQWSTNNINDYINGRTKIFPHDAVRIIETLLKRSLQNRIKIVKNKCYFLNTESTKVEDDYEKQYGFKQRHGFIQALNLSSQKLTLNIQTKLTTFYSDIPLLEFIHKQIGHDQIPTNKDFKKLNRILNNCIIVTKQSNWKTEYEFDRFDHRRPDEISFESGELLSDYFRDKKKIILEKTDYPCIQVYLRNKYDKPCHLPLEVCKVKEWQVYDELPSGQEGRNHIPTPEKRYYKIRNTLRDCDYNSNLLCQVIGFHVGNNEMLELDARILMSPKIISGLNHPARVDNGRIFLDGQLYVPKLISTLAITYFGTNFDDNKSYFDYFTDTLVGVMKRYSIYGSHEEHIVTSSFEDIDGYFRGMSEQNCQFIVCVMDENNEDDLTQLKVNIKKCGIRIHGILTQCTSFSEIPSDEKSLKNYCENLVRKINFRNGGINTIVDLDVALKDKKTSNDFYMFFGADVIHPTNVTRQHPSIAAMVGSGNSSCSTTADCVCKQYPKQGKCSIEIILGMTEMVQQLLNYYHQLNQHLPNKIVFYRDGVDDGQFSKVLDIEIPAIRQAFNNMYGDKSKHPLLTLVIVKKRHNTRFFTYNPNAIQKNPRSKKQIEETDNMSIGCVIDTTIVHPYQYNFYINSHNAYQGVNHPSLYHVLLNEIEFTADQLQLLTYLLCFTDPRSSASEAIPSVVHQADKAAFNARDLFFNDEDSSTMNVHERYKTLHNPTANDFDYEILQVHENLKNKFVFG